MAAIRERTRLPGDAVLFNATLALLVIGVVAVFDASYARSMDLRSVGNDAFFYLKRQALYAVVGLAAMTVASRVGYWKLRRYAGWLLVISAVLLCLVWVPHVGLARNGASRWIGHGIVQLQPSELAKLGLLLYLAALLSRPDYRIRELQEGLLPPVVVTLMFFLLVEREPDLGTASVLLLGALTLFYLAGAQLKHIAGLVAVFGLLGVILISLHGFRGGRIGAWINPDRDALGRGYQAVHGLVAVGSGGLTGVGLGAGREKFYLPEANTDYIFATIAEETGLWGGVLVIGLLFLVGRQGFVIARRTRDPFGALLASGIAAIISWQAVINVAVVTGSVPATGVPLPFVSQGGSSLVFLLIGVGVLLNISQHPDAASREARQSVPAAAPPPLKRAVR